MTPKDIETIAINLKGADDYYAEFKKLKSDMQFFRLYMERNKKSDFNFVIIPRHGMSNKSFEDIWKAISMYDEYLENAYATFVVMREIILDIYNETGKFTNNEIKEFANYLTVELSLDLENYVSDFVGCSMGCATTRRKIYDILRG